MISVIGQSDFGLYTLATSLVTMVTIDLGLSSAVTRFVSKYKAENNTEGIKKFLGITYKLFILMSFIFLMSLTVLYFNVERIFIKLTPAELEKVKVLFSIAGLYAVFSFPFNTLDGLLISNEKFIFQKSISLLNRVLTIVLMVVALMLGYGLYSLVVVNVLSGSLMIAIKLKFINKTDKLDIDWKCFDFSLFKQILSFSLWVMVISIAQRLILNITPSVLGITSGSKEIAIFSAAMMLEGYVWTFATVLSGMFLPKVSNMIFKKNMAIIDIEKLMLKIGRIQFLLISVIVSIFIVVGKDFIVCWLGPNFEKSYYITVLLILPSLITIPQEIANTTLIALNKVKYSAYSKLVIAFLSISASYFLSLKYASLGAGIAIFIGNVIGGIFILNFIYVKVLRMNILSFFYNCQLKMILPFIIIIISGIFLNFLIIFVSWETTILKISILFIIYIVSSYFLALNKYEKNFFVGILKRMRL